MLSGLSGGGSAAAAPITADHYYPLNTDADDTGTGTAIDGTEVGTISYVTNGQGGQAASIPAGDAIEFGSAAAIELDSSVDWEWECRAKAAAGASNSALLFARLSSTWQTGAKQIYLAPSTGYFIFTTFVGNVFSVATDYRDNAWHVFKIRVQNGFCTAHVDGELVFAGAVSIQADNTDTVSISSQHFSYDPITVDYVSYDLL